MPSRRGVIDGVVAAFIVGALAWVASHIGASVPAWVLIPVAAVAAFVGHQVTTYKRHSQLLSTFNAQHATDAILTLRKILDGELTGISFDEFVERGILEPARLGLAIAPEEDIRLSVLELDAKSGQFTMSYCAGHSIGRKQDFRLPRESMAGHAMQSRELQWTNDVSSDQRWRQHPSADPKRSYKSLVAMPIESGGEVVAVLNVVSTEPGAFLQSDLVYIELLGTLIGLAWAIGRGSAGEPHTIAKPQT
jgi:GAF domain-containing protein